MADGTSLAMQKAVVTRLRGSADVLAIVPSADIMDRSTRPEKNICIILGENQIVREPITYDDAHIRLFVTMHLWHRAQEFSTLMNLADAIRKAMRARFVVPGIYVHYMALVDCRYLRDPGGEYVHGVVTFSVVIQEPEMAL